MAMSIFKSLTLVAALALLGAAAVYLIAPDTFIRLAINAERRAAGLEPQEVIISGLTVQYLDSGGPGTPLLLVHGFSADKDSWTGVSRHLGGRYRILALDLPGFGASDSPMNINYGVGAQVQRLHEFTDAIGLTHMHLGGSSMGGAVVASYAAKYPNQVASLWLIAPGSISRVPTGLQRQKLAHTGNNELIPTTPEEYEGLINTLMSKPPYLPAALKRIRAERAIAVSTLREKQFADLLDEALILEDKIKGMPIPAHMLWGDQDRVHAVGGVDVLMDILPQSSRTILSGIGHLPMLEAAEASAKDYLAFREAVRL